MKAVSIINLVNKYCNEDNLSQKTLSDLYQSLDKQPFFDYINNCVKQAVSRLHPVTDSIFRLENVKKDPISFDYGCFWSDDKSKKYGNKGFAYETVSVVFSPYGRPENVFLNISYKIGIVVPEIMMYDNKYDDSIKINGNDINIQDKISSALNKVFGTSDAVDGRKKFLELKNSI